jgi:hypothetical protein
VLRGRGGGYSLACNSSSLSVLASGQSTPASRAYIAISLMVVLLTPSAAATCRMLRPASPASS